MPVVRLGNPAAIDHPNDNTIRDEVLVTTIHVPEHQTHSERIRNITHPDGSWARVSAAEAPLWVYSNDPKLETALAAYWDCPAGEPDLDNSPDDTQAVTNNGEGESH